MKKNIITILITLFSINSVAQYSTDWIRPAQSNAKTGSMIARDNQDNVIATGYAVNNNGYTRKYNKFGVLQWEAITTSGIASTYERLLWVTTDNNNNVFVAGYQYSGSNALGVIVLKYSPDGNLLWKQVINPVNYLVGMSLRCELDNNGNLYVGACGVGNLPGFALIKFDTNGNILFTQHSDANAPAYFESMRLKGNKIVMSASGGNPNIAVITAWDTTGALLWTAGVQGRGARDVEIDDAGNAYLLTGYFNQVTATSQNDIEIFKFSPSGTQLWKKDFDFGGTDFPTRFTYVAGKLSIIGQSQSLDTWITFQVNTDGAMLWNTAYNGAPGFEEAPYFIAAKTNGEVFVTGKGGPNVDPNNVPSLRMITLKYGNTGVQQWVDSTNIYSGWGYGCTLASDNSLYVLSGTAMTVFHFMDHSGTGTCNMPVGLNVANIANNLATVSWAPVAGAALYHLRYKPTTAGSWTVVSGNLTTMNIFGLYSGTTYEYAVEAVCSNGPSGYSATQTFTTTGTGICSSVGQNQVQEYLSQVWLSGILLNNSGRNNGYGDFTNQIATLTRGQNVQGFLSGLVPYPEYEYYSIWIDYNHDNDFADVGEEVVSIYSDFSGYNAFNFTVPSAAPLGTTRMRVIMSHDSPPTPCGAYARGETEDYTVLINSNSIAPPPVPLGLNVSNITNASATFTWTPDTSAASYNLRYKKTTDASWTVAPVNATSITVPALAAGTAYNFSCEAIGSVANSGYGGTQTFTTIGTVIPINGIEVQAKRQGGDVILSWSTQSEQNSAYFDVERSYDGTSFTKIGQVSAAGYSNSVRQYQFADVNVAKAMIFYRLKLVDADGSNKLSPTRVVAKLDNSKQSFLLYPNPAVSNVNLLLNEAAKADMQVHITNSMGQMVQSTRITKGTQLIKLNIGQLPKGIYTVMVVGNEMPIVQKLLVR